MKFTPFEPFTEFTPFTPFDAERYTIQQQAEQLKAWRRTCLEAMAWCAHGEAKRAHQLLQQQFNA